MQSLKYYHKNWVASSEVGSMIYLRRHGKLARALMSSLKALVQWQATTLLKHWAYRILERSR